MKLNLLILFGLTTATLAAPLETSTAKNLDHRDEKAGLGKLVIYPDDVIQKSSSDKRDKKKGLAKIVGYYIYKSKKSGLGKIVGYAEYKPSGAKADTDGKMARNVESESHPEMADDSLAARFLAARCYTCCASDEEGNVVEIDCPPN